MEISIFNLYQTLGEYFTGNRRKKPLYIGLLLIFIFLSFLSYQLKIIVDKETLYWVFSSLVQALLALVALMGVVSIFKLQNLYNDESRILDETNDIQRSYYSALNGRYWTIDALKSALTVFLSNPNVGKANPLFSMQQRVDDLLLSKRLVIDYAVKYTVYTFAVVLVALLFLMLVPQISALHQGVNSLYLIFCLTSYSLFLAAKGFIYTI